MTGPAAPEPRTIGRINWLGLWTHYVKEVRRFLKVGLQTLVSPIVTVILFLAVFTLAIGEVVETVPGVSFGEFLAPGLIMMAIIQNSFANTTSSMMISKIQGNIVDMLMPPLTPGELVAGFALGGATRGLLVAFCTALAVSVVVPIRIQDFGIIAFHAIGASMLLSLLGLLTAIWADKFDNVASITNFIITPFSFLSGTFYTIDTLPGVWSDVAQLNPFFYLIDGFRSGFIGHADSAIWLGMVVVIVANIGLWIGCHVMFARGYKLKA